jgi:hypothetical protein
MPSNRQHWSQQSGKVTIEKDGKKYTGTWTADRGVIVVTALGQERRAPQVGGARPEPTAKLLLREIVEAGGTA